MFIWRIQPADFELAKYMATKALMSGVVLVGLGLLILVVPQLVVIPLAIVFFIVGFLCLSTAWRIYWTAKRVCSDHAEKEYEDASYRELP